MRTNTFLVVLSSFAFGASANCLVGTHLHRRQDSGVKVSNYSYSGESGPINWAALNPANHACAQGNFQSPIVLNNTVPFAVEAPVVSIPDVSSAKFDNLGSTLQVTVNGTTLFEGEEYALRQFHFHTPSEHRINDEFYPLEMHMVHEGVNGSIEVITAMFELSECGETTELLTSVIQNIDEVEYPGNSTTTGPLDFGKLIDTIHTKPLYHYNGSLTTPPCTEGITFLIVAEPLPIDVRTFNAIKHIIKFNARYAQNTLGSTNLLQVLSDLNDGQFVEGGLPGGNATDVVISSNATSAAGNSTDSVQVAPVQQRSPSVKFRV